MVSSFSKNNERDIQFKIVEDPDGWNTSSEEIFTVSGIVSYSSPSVKPEEYTELGSTNIRLFFSIEQKGNIELLSIGDIAVVDGASFQIKIIDDRGVRPSQYPIRVEAVRL